MQDSNRFALQGLLNADSITVSRCPSAPGPGRHKSAQASQPVFARYLNTSESTVQKWEAGTKRPSGMALKLLALVQKHGLTVLA